MLFVILILLLIDLLSFKGFYSLLKNKDKTLKWFLIALHWAVPISLFSASMILIKFYNESHTAREVYRSFILAGLFLLFYIPKLFFVVFHVLDDVLNLVYRTMNLLFKRPIRLDSGLRGKPTSRRYFLTKTGLALASIPFISVLYGTARGRFNFRLEEIRLNFSSLPENFDGLRLIQISDFHIASFHGHEDQLEKVVEIINSYNADLILFTGDFVNIYANEISPFINILKKLKAKEGMYSILGNHDYGDYHQWSNEEEKKNNFKAILKYQEEIGFKMLLNESVLLNRKDESIAIAGVENWGKPPFAQYGKLKQALKEIPEKSFKILLSHDPSHWDEEVVGKENIQLSLSGHTHGMQFGIKIGDKRWSPVQYKYPRWGGLYREENQYLYVNRGLGCIAYPGRVGMPPEITLIELLSS